MMTETYPSNKVIETQYDGAGRIAGVKKQGASGFIAGAASSDAVNRLQYTASGAVRAMKLGNGLWEHTNFNSRLQPVQIGLGVSSTTSERLQLDYGYGASASVNNGNITSQQITAPGFSVTQNYSYDQVNRLASATETAASVQTWQQVYGYDVYGNRWVNPSSYIPTPALTPQSQSAFNSSNNRLVSGLGYNYDLVGNVTKDPTTAAGAMVYDGENRQTSYTKSGVTTSYGYDGDGRRVKKVDSTGTTVFVYNAGGQLIAEYVENGGGGTMQTSYLTSDHLGSTRVVTDGAGVVKARHDYLPFGEELGSGIGGRSTAQGYSAADNLRMKFTSKERDNESGLDYFINRYYSSAQGRFTSADPVPMTSQRPSDPQRLNLYAYVRNNPLVHFDPNGLDLYATGDAAKDYVRYLESATGLKLDYNEQSGKITIAKEPDKLSKTAEKIKAIIGDPNASIKIEALKTENPGSPVLIGRFDGGGHQTLDFGDIKQASKKGGVRPEDVVVHETVEAYEGKDLPSPVSLADFITVHNKAIEYENDVRSNKKGYSPRIPETQVGLSAIPTGGPNNETLYEINYATHREVIVFQNGGTIKSVKVEKKP